MKRTALKRILAAFMLSIASMSVFSAAPTWEQVETPVREVQNVDQEAELDISVKHNEVVITTNKPVTVKVFTILGQLISQETLKSGTHRLRLPSRGIYILKAGSVTRRITL